jgi:hypothetical protein
VTAYPPPYQAYPGPLPVPAAPPPIMVAVADQVPQRRATVAFRLILLVPHLFLLYFVSLAASVVAFIGWWGALFTGRLPQFAVTFLSGFLRWTTRVHAYDLLLTDVYPPFTFDEEPTYPVRLAIPEPQRLNRAAVFFRYFLAFPASLLAALLLWGAGTLMAFVAWLITLVAGQLPPSFYLAYVAVLRFTTRYYGYWWMLTPAYPGGLYGDRPGATAWANGQPAAPVPGSWQPAPGFGTPGFGTQGFGTPGPGYGAAGPGPAGPGTAGPGYGNPAGGAPQGYGVDQGYAPTQGYGSPQSYGTPPGYGATQGQAPAQGYGTPQGAGAPQGYGAPGYGAPAGYGAAVGGYGAAVGYGVPGGYGVRPVFQPVTWLLPLTSAARTLVTTFIVLGALFAALYVGLYAVIIGSAINSAGQMGTAGIAVSELGSSYTALSTQLNTLDQANTACGQDLSCTTQVDSKYASAFDTFSGQLASIPVPNGSAAAEARLSADATTAAQDYTQLSQATTAAQYQSLVASTGIEQTLDSVDSDYTALVTSLQETTF